MINVIYLVLVLSNGSGMAVTLIPQANMAQCNVNVKNYGKRYIISEAYCIAGVK